MADDIEHSDFVQKLIDAVRERRCLYDKKHIAYFNRREREKAWRQIGQQLGRRDVDCHKRWKLLREKLAKELKKRDKALENGEQFQSDWACFESIMFVEDHIAPRKKLDRQPLMLVKDLSKKRNLIDNDSKNAYEPVEKHGAYATANNFNFFMQLTKATTTTTSAQQSTTTGNLELPIGGNSFVKSEPIDKKSDDLNSNSTINENPCSPVGNQTTSSTILNNDENDDEKLPPTSTLDLTKAVDILLKDLRQNKETNLSFVKNLTNALKLKDLDFFKYDNQMQLEKSQQLNVNSKNDDTDLSDVDEDEDSVSKEDSFMNDQMKANRFPIHFKTNATRNGFTKESSTSFLGKTEQLNNAGDDLKVSSDTVKRQCAYEMQQTYAEKDELFGKLVTSMLADITDEEYKDDTKFSIMQVLINAKRACRNKNMN